MMYPNISLKNEIVLKKLKNELFHVADQNLKQKIREHDYITSERHTPGFENSDSELSH